MCVETLLKIKCYDRQSVLSLTYKGPHMPCLFMNPEHLKSNTQALILNLHALFVWPSVKALLSSVHLHKSHQVFSCLNAKQQPTRICMWDILGRLREAEVDSTDKTPSQSRRNEIKLTENKCCVFSPGKGQQIQFQKNKKGNTAYRYLKTSWIHYKNLNIYTPQICKVCVYVHAWICCRIRNH